MNIKWDKLLISIFISFLPGIIGSLFMIGSIEGWYATLNKPWFTPPDWVFGPVWTTLYILMGCSLYLIWIKKMNKNDKNYYITLFASQLFLNGLWTPVFFSLHFLAFSLVIIALLLSLVASLIILLYFYRNKTAAFFLIPYIIWLIIATMLNIGIIILNPGAV